MSQDSETLTRREFSHRMAGGTLALGGLTILQACGGVHRSVGAPRAIQPSQGDGDAHGTRILDDRERAVLRYASLAPSGHNTQPWRITVKSPTHWVLGTDPARWLPEVDPENRETLLSLGAFLENLVVAGRALGRQVDVSPLTSDPMDQELAEIRLDPTSPGEAPLDPLESRRTLREGYASRELERADVDAILSDLDGKGIYHPGGSSRAGWLAEAEVEAFRKQSYRDSAQEELSRWIRFGEDEARRHRDGLTPETMEVGFMARFFMRHFMGPEDVLKESFRKKGVDGVASQVKEGAGWLVIPGSGDDVADLLATGRRFQRMALRVRRRKVAIHPMSQILEEAPWQNECARALGLERAPQFILRVGYRDDYPDPVSLRRPVHDFVS